MDYDTKEFGRHNDYPPNWKEISEEAFWRKFMVYGWSAHEHRQMFRPTEVHMAMGKKHEQGKLPQITDAKLFFYSDKTGLAMERIVEKARTVRPRFYSFAICEHLKKEAIASESRMCFHVSRCVDCGMRFEVDSSD